MAIDTSMYSNVQMPQIMNPMDIAAKAMTMKQLSQQSQEYDRKLADENAYKQAFSNNIKMSDDGQATVDRKGVLSSLAKTSPLKLVETQKSFSEMDKLAQSENLEKIKSQKEIAKNILWQINDEPSYQAGLAAMKQAGLPNIDKYPPSYDPNLIKNLQLHSLDGEKQLEQSSKSESLGETKRHNLAMEGKVGKLNVGRQDDKDAASLDKHLKTGWAGRSGNAGIVQGKINSAEIAEQLIEQGKGQKGGLDSRQIEELAQSTARLLGGGAQASGRVEALVPHTMWGKTQSLAEWLTNNPTGTGQEEFVKRMAETVAREKSLAQDQMKKLKVSGLPVYNSFKKRNPELYKQILQANEFDDSMIDDKGRYKKQDEATVITDQNGKPSWAK